MYIRRPLQSVERVRLHLLAYKATLEEDISPASPGSQAAEIDESCPPGALAAPRQLESRIPPGAQAAGILEPYRPDAQAA